MAKTFRHESPEAVFKKTRILTVEEFDQEIKSKKWVGPDGKPISILGYNPKNGKIKIGEEISGKGANQPWLKMGKFQEKYKSVDQKSGPKIEEAETGITPEKETEETDKRVEEVIEKDVFSKEFLEKYYAKEIEGSESSNGKDEKIEEYSGELQEILREKLEEKDFVLGEFILKYFSEKKDPEMKGVFEEVIFEKKYPIGEDLWDEKRQKCIRILGYDRKKEEGKRILVSEKQTGDKTGSIRTVSVADLDKLFVENDYGFHSTRAAAEHTLHGIKDYSELLDKDKTEIEKDKKGKIKSIRTETTRAESDGVFLKKTRELWKKFAVHGIMEFEKDGSKRIKADTDLDGKSFLKLLELAGFDTGDVKYVEPGEIRDDALTGDSGKKHGVVSLNRGKELVIDHHTPESDRFSSAAKFAYEMLVETGLLKKEKYLDEFVRFVADEDNKIYETSELERMFNPNKKGEKPFYHKTLAGISRYMSMDDILEFFREGRSPKEKLDKKYLESHMAVGMKKDDATLLDASNELGWKMKQSRESIREIERNELVVDTDNKENGIKRFGKVIIDTGIIYKGKNRSDGEGRLVKKISLGFEAARAMGYGGYLLWLPETNSFKLYTERPMDFDFSQGLSIRGNFWNKPPQIDEPLEITLEEILSKLAGREFKIEGKLKEALEKDMLMPSSDMGDETGELRKDNESRNAENLTVEISPDDAAEKTLPGSKSKIEKKQVEFNEKEKRYLNAYIRLTQASLDHMEEGNYLIDKGYDPKDKMEIQTIKKADLKKFWEHELYEKLLDGGKFREEIVPEAIAEIKKEVEKLNRLRAQSQAARLE